MLYSEPTRTTIARKSRLLLAVLLVFVAGILGILGYEWLPMSSPSTSGRPDAGPLARLAPRHHGPLGEADGVVPAGATVFDDRYPAVAKLDPALLRALRRAAGVAAGDAIVFYVDSGWRSATYQQQLLQQAIAKYGSLAKAAQWVATPYTSAHVSGDAVDIGHANATAWLSKHGAAYGLCQIYRNESWHYELRPTAVTRGCPPMYADPTHDPRMRSAEQ